MIKISRVIIDILILTHSTREKRPYPEKPEPSTTSAIQWIIKLVRHQNQPLYFTPNLAINRAIKQAINTF
jgi:hypothetical protein